MLMGRMVLETVLREVQLLEIVLLRGLFRFINEEGLRYKLRMIRYLFLDRGPDIHRIQISRFMLPLLYNFLVKALSRVYSAC